MPGYQKIFKTKIIPQYAFFKFLASPMFCLEYMISSDLIFSMEFVFKFVFKTAIKLLKKK